MSSERCTTLSPRYRNSNGSIKTTACIMVYQDRHCTPPGFLIISEQPVLWVRQRKYNGDSHLKYSVSSLADCSEMQTRNEIDVDIYEKQYRKGEIVAKFRDMCDCKNLPKFLVDKRISANVYGNCVSVYKRENCKGKPWEKYGEHDTTDFRILDDNGEFHSILSMKQCAPTTHCRRVKLSATILKLEVLSDLPNIPDSIQEVILRDKHTVTNNGNSEQEQVYEVIKQVTETTQSELSESLSEFTSLSISTGLEATAEAGVQGIGKLTEKITSTINAGISTTKVAGTSKTNTVQNKQEIRFRKNIKIPPCTKQEVTSVLRMAENVEIRYRMQLNVTGQFGSGDRMNADQLRSNLNELTFLNNLDEFSVIAVTDAKLKMSYEVDTDTYIVGTPLPECITKYRGL
ncbi:unnamed protein product [Orchesella dallaii]